MELHSNFQMMLIWRSKFKHGTITEKSSVTFSLGGDNLKRYFDQR